MYLLDTDTLIYSLKGHLQVGEQLGKHVNDPMCMSVVSLMELYYGARKSLHQEANVSKVRTLEETFPVIPVGPELAITFGNVKTSLEQQGTPLDDFDLIIASTALAHNCTLVSNNTRHFARVEGLSLENWVDPSS